MGDSVVKILPAVQEMWKMQIQFLGQNNPLEKEMATHSSILARINPTDRGAWQAVVHDNTKSGT